MATTSVGAVSMDLTLDSKNYNKQLNAVTKSTESAFSSTMKKVGGLIAGAFAVKQVVDFTKTAVNSASQVQSAFTGLNSIVQGTGNSFTKAQKFINEYTSDGLVSINEAATAYKNLLSRGYDTSQIEDVMTRLKDSAAFGRQASYDLGEAVVTATEGLKNENSILVDNAGVTKNVAKMWDEYAKSIGTSANNLTQSQKIQAEYNGIMKETQFQVGDASAYTRTFSGQVQQLKFNLNQMMVAVGKVVAPIAQLFIPVLNAAMQAVTNLFQSIQSVLKVFGLDMPDVVSKTSSAVNGVSADIESTGDSAVSAAKKINKAFAGVDEINVLKTSDSTNSGNDSTSNTAGAAISVNPASDDTVSTAISTTVEKIRKYIEPLQNINFDPLIDAFSNLWDQVSPIIQKIGDLLNWLWFEVITPYIGYLIESWYPAVVNFFAGALSILNPILESFSNIFQPVWENLLKPFLSWTGNAIVGVLESVAGALTNIGNWMSDNQGVVDAIVISLTTFFGLWKVTELMSFIGQAGGVTKALKDMTKGFKDVIAKKLQDKKDTIVLTAMYAKDFLVSLASTTKQLITQAAQWIKTTALKVADTTATTAATAATWLFNTALTVLTSPITLVVAAIAALIAIIVLLVNNWEVVSKAASDCWNWIVNAWNNASEWFNTTIIQPVTNFFTDMWNNLKNGAANAYEGVKQIFSGVADFFGNIFGNAWQKVKDVFSIGGKIFDGIKEGILSAFKEVVNTIIRGINTVVMMPFNGLNGVLNTIQGVNILGLKPFDWLTWRAPVPQIPYLAQGGWFERGNPQLAIVGDNTREGEIVTPESKIYDQVRNAIRDSGGTGKQEIEITIYHKYEDGRTIIQKINQAQIDAGQVLILS